MTIKDLQGVLCGRVTLYEPIPGQREFKDLYCGMSQEIPEELQSRDVDIASPVARHGKDVTIDIQLKLGRKKAHEKSPA